MGSLTAGLDMYIPLSDVPGNYRNALLAAGAELNILNTVKISSGFSVGGNQSFNIPLGIVLAPGKGTYEFGIASRDMVTYFTNKNPNVSAVFGFLRFGLF
jgi:hypothetical protein